MLSLLLLKGLHRRRLRPLPPLSAGAWAAVGPLRVWPGPPTPATLPALLRSQQEGEGRRSAGVLRGQQGQALSCGITRREREGVQECFTLSKQAALHGGGGVEWDYSELAQK